MCTHSTDLLAALRQGLAQEPTFELLGGQQMTLDQWMTASEQVSVEELVDLPMRNLAVFRQIHQLLGGAS